jgi:DNA-binding MarR family transcriptional regulator
MNLPLPLPTLLSQALVAFIIEFDNEFEHRMPHRTTNHGSTAGARDAPWLVSMAMWSNFMQFVDEDGIPVAELRRRLGTSPKSTRNWLTRMGQWWGYVAVGPSKLVRPTTAGRAAIAVWRPLAGIIEERWRDRFGKDRFGANRIDRLRESLRAVTSRIGVELPDGLPILEYGLFTRHQACVQPAIREISLPALLSKALLWFAVAFETESEVSLAICANVLRLAAYEKVRVRDLPSLAGVSKEAIAMALSFLTKRGYAAIEQESPATRVKVVDLTPGGRRAADTYRRLVWTIEERWKVNFGEDVIRELRESLESLVSERHILFQGLAPYPDGWRASVQSPEVLPHYPMILHRGGFPDGS